MPKIIDNNTASFTPKTDNFTLQFLKKTKKTLPGHKLEAENKITNYQDAK